MAATVTMMTATYTLGTARLALAHADGVRGSAGAGRLRWLHPQVHAEGPDQHHDERHADAEGHEADEGVQDADGDVLAPGPARPEDEGDAAPG